MTNLRLLFIVSGFVTAGLAVPLILGKIPPNGLYGLRVRKTLERPEIWYPVNAYAGKWFFSASLCLVLAALLQALVPGMLLETYALSVLVVWVIIFSLAMAASLRRLDRY